MQRLLASVSILFAVIFSSVSAFALDQHKTLLISDIDDTIKVSHILSYRGKVSRAADITTPFAGMSQMYHLLQKMNPNQTEIVYLSNAPEEIAGVPALKVSHENFLKYNDFPKGDLVLREDLGNANHKLNYIRKLINEKKPSVVVLIGDNGELDNEVYHQIFEEYKSTGIKIMTFIHLLYSSKAESVRFWSEVGKSIYPEQIGYVTPIEISVELQQQGILNQEALSWMIENVSPYIVNEKLNRVDAFKPITFPYFSSCVDFQWRWTETPALTPLVQRLKKQCNLI